VSGHGGIDCPSTVHGAFVAGEFAMPHQYTLMLLEMPRQ
jgi:hypothetical protein